MNPYLWPVVGKWLRFRRRKLGELVGRALILRGYSPDRVIEYANRHICIAAKARKTGDLNEYIGIATAARAARGGGQ